LKRDRQESVLAKFRQDLSLTELLMDIQNEKYSLLVKRDRQELSKYSKHLALKKSSLVILWFRLEQSPKLVYLVAMNLSSL
jgi:hypothetical protein